MRRRTPRTRRLPLAVATCALLAAGATFAAAVAQGRGTDDTIVAQTVVSDPVGDEAGNGPDLSSLTVTTYADQSLGFVVQDANRGLLLSNETIQIFLDLNDDGQSDLNFSLWPSGSASYLARWTGSEWQNVRQLPEAVQGQGSYSVRLPISVLRDAAAVAPATHIGVVVGSYTYSWTSNTFNSAPADWLPDNRIPVQHSLVATTATTTAPAPTTTAPPTVTTPRGPQPTLSLACVKHKLHATVKPPKGQKIVFVTFAVNGNARSTDTRSPFVGIFAAKGPTTNVSAAVHFATRTVTLRKSIAHAC